MGLFDSINEPEDADKPDPRCIAVVADFQGHGCILWCDGFLIEQEIEQIGRTTEDLGLDAPDGISVWEGTVRYTGSGEDIEGELVGTFRAPTDDEWSFIMNNTSPFSKSEEEPAVPAEEEERVRVYETDEDLGEPN